MAFREWAYVAGSRFREKLHIHADKATLAELAPSWSKPRQKDVTLEYRSSGLPEKASVELGRIIR